MSSGLYIQIVLMSLSHLVGKPHGKPNYGQLFSNPGTGRRYFYLHIL